MRAVVRVCLALSLLTTTAFAEEWTVMTLGGRCGPGSYDGNGVVASFERPMAVATDSNGNVYVADTGNETVRKIAPSGDVFTLAGLAGQSSWSSTDGTRGAARFGDLEGIAVDAAGNVFVSDRYRDQIRKITADGVVTTFAGGNRYQVGNGDGTGTAAYFSNPGQLSFDAAGNLYVADDRAIRKITTTAVVTTLLANGSTITGIAADPMGNIYFTDGPSIRLLTTTGSVSTIAGGTTTGTVDGTGAGAQFGGACYLALDASGNVYASDRGTFPNAPTIRRMTPGGNVTTIAGSPAAPTTCGDTDGIGSVALFCAPGPRGLAVDPTGNVYVADSENNTIRRIAPGGVVTTFAGRSGVSFAGPDGPIADARFGSGGPIAFDSGGNLWIGETGSDRLRKLSPAGIVSTLPGTSFSTFEDITADAGGNLWIADYCALWKVTSAGAVTLFAGQTADPRVLDGTGTAARFNHLYAAASDGNGTLYLGASDHIRKVTTADAVVTTLAGINETSRTCTDGSGSNAHFGGIWAMTWDANGILYVADAGCSTIRKVTPSAVVTTLAGQSLTQGMVDGSGTSARFDAPEDIAADGAGNLLVIDGTYLRKCTTSGVVTTLAGTDYTSSDSLVDGTGSNAHLGRAIMSMAFDRQGVLYIFDGIDGRLRTARPAIADAATISAPNVSRYTVVQLDTTAQTATSWKWEIVRRPAGSTAQLSSTAVRNPTFAPDIADLYTFQLTASSAAGVRISKVDLSVSAVCNPLTAVSAAVSGSTNICDLATGGTATAAATGGGAVTYQWGWRATAGGAITNIAGATSSKYTIRGPDFGIVGTAYLVCTIKPECGSTMPTSNIAVTLDHALCSTLKGDVNGDGTLSAGDVFYLINHLFAGGPGPIGPGDVNADTTVSVADVFYLINHLFAGGPAPK